MVRSMTAYGRAEKKTTFGRWIVELHSVNRKMLDIHVLMAKEFLRFDLEVRNWLAEELMRGQVTVRITHQLDESAAASTLASLKKQKNMWEKLARALGYDPKEVDLRFLLERTPQSMSADLLAEKKEMLAGLKAATGTALQALMAMKVREGKNLAQDLQKLLGDLEKALAQVAKLAPQVTENLRKKLLEKLQGIVPLTAESEERYFREVAFFAEKSDITEELTRLKSHIAQFRHYLASKEKSVGKTLDFLTQEMHRELSTLAAKTQEGEISRLSVLMRSTCEKIKEQVQNIE